MHVTGFGQSWHMDDRGQDTPTPHIFAFTPCMFILLGIGTRTLKKEPYKIHVYKHSAVNKINPANQLGDVVPFRKFTTSKIMKNRQTANKFRFLKNPQKVMTSFFVLWFGEEGGSRSCPQAPIKRHSRQPKACSQIDNFKEIHVYVYLLYVN